MDSYERLLEVSMREFERSVVSQVELAFAALPNKVCPLPFIDGTFNPHACEEHADQKQRVIRALCCRQRFEFEASKRCQPLPLCEKERVLFNNSNDRQLWVTANYAMTLQSMDWRYERAPSFFDFIMQSAPPRG
jgi:hypothetical protein